MANFRYPNSTDVSSIVNLLGYNNDVTGGWFGLVILIMVFVISVLSLKTFEMNKAVTAAAFFTAIVGLLFRLMGILADNYFWIPWIFVALGVIWLQFEK